MDLTKLLKQGEIKNVPEIPNQHIETVMSDVFIYDDIVRKVYKQDREGFFLDLRNPETRKQFYQEDFYWNQTVSPKIHKHLHGVIEKNGTYHIVDSADADNWFIEMNLVPEGDTLLQRLKAAKVTESQVRNLAKKQTLHLKNLTEKWLTTHQDVLDQSLPQLWRDRIDQDLRGFGKSFGKQISPELVDQRTDQLLDIFAASDYFTALTPEHASLAIDNHSGNVVFIEDEPEFIDIFLVKREWRVIDSFHNIARIAACVRTLGGDLLADAMYEEYGKIHPLPSIDVQKFVETYNAYIKGYYYTYLKQPDLAKKYFDFADKNLSELQ